MNDYDGGTWITLNLSFPTWVMRSEYCGDVMRFVMCCKGVKLAVIV